MTRTFLGLLLIAALVAAAASGCQSTGGRGYGSSNSHAGHNH